MPTPVDQMLPQIVALNTPDRPFSYYAEGNTIVGWWDSDKIRALYPSQASEADESYRLTVTLFSHIGSFDYSESRNSATWGAGYNDDGFKSSGLKRSVGKRTETRFSFTFGRGDSDTDSEPADSGYHFDASEIKACLFDWLQSHGWRHNSATGRLFAP